MNWQKLYYQQQEYVKKLEKRIHNQRVALRQNWQIIETRADYKKFWPYKSSYLKNALKLYKENFDLEQKIKKLKFLGYW